MPALTLILDDLMPFADFGSTAEEGDGSFSLYRNGLLTEVVPTEAGYIVRTPQEPEQLLKNAGALLASSRFADLGRIAQNQAVVLGAVRMRSSPVPITSELKQVAGSVPDFIATAEPWKALDSWLQNLEQTKQEDSIDLLLIDGPAGVGKTTIVREAALLRAESYDGSLPLIVQIVSRGRVLQNISDLIAFALQDVRANLTIRELMVLIRHGLITLAIDGFDELSDPNGFQTAWSGLNTLFEGARGVATILLAGRETFISTQTIQRQLTSFRPTNDRLSSLSLSDPYPEAARAWLLNQPGWNADLLTLDFVEPIFVSKSYALRPFFLDVIAREPDALRDSEPPASDLLTYLVDVMSRREAQKFFESLDPPNGNEAIKVYGEYVGRFLEEVARDLAENQTDALADDALDLLATVAANGLLPDDQIPAVVQRARTIVFLANDVQPGHVRFAHEQLQQHF
ncbi:NACHT domain-containing protein [Sphingomonas sp. LR60]|uniref:NACHT domain-containing protein n=1 Tax=Sphingomonas sp. LR60 TaxID=3050233 RepID=UPI002FE2B1E9